MRGSAGAGWDEVLAAGELDAPDEIFLAGRGAGRPHG